MQDPVFNQAINHADRSRFRLNCDQLAVIDPDPDTCLLMIAVNINRSRVPCCNGKDDVIA